MPTDTPLHKAAHNGDLAAVKNILEEGEIEVDAAGAAERRPLHRAAGGNHTEICKYLVEKGAQVDQVSSLRCILAMSPVLTEVNHFSCGCMESLLPHDEQYSSPLLTPDTLHTTRRLTRAEGPRSTGLP